MRASAARGDRGPAARPVTATAIRGTASGPVTRVTAVAARYGITVPFDGIPLGEQRTLFESLPDLGYTDVWSAESMGADGFTPLALASVWAPSLRLGTAIIPAYTRGPATLAVRPLVSGRDHHALPVPRQPAHLAPDHPVSNNDHFDDALIADFLHAGKGFA